MLAIRRFSYPIKKRGENVKYQGRKKCKTTNNLFITDNKYYILGVSDCLNGNNNDVHNIIENTNDTFHYLNDLKIDFCSSHLNGDSNFDAIKFRELLEIELLIIPNIPTNKRNNKSKKINYQYFSEYIYGFRTKIERTFAWLDSYKRVLIRFEYLARNFKSWLLVAASLINFKEIIKNPEAKRKRII